MVSRIIPLEGVNNIRDLGGMVNKDGYIVKDKKLIRSSQLFYATDDDLRILYYDYDVRRIVDFRSHREKQEKPDPLYKNIYYHDLLVHTDRMFAIEKDEESRKRLMEYWENAFNSPQGQREHMKGFYRMLAEDYSVVQYGKFLKLLLESDHAVLWHCSVGKDRCGIGSALVETLLGIDWESIIEDYEYSNICRFGHNHPEETVEGYGDFCHGEYLETYFEEIEGRFGNMDNMFDYIGIGKKDRESFRRKYLIDYK